MNKRARRECSCVLIVTLMTSLRLQTILQSAIAYKTSTQGASNLLQLDTVLVNEAAVQPDRLNSFFASWEAILRIQADSHEPSGRLF